MINTINTLEFKHQQLNQKYIQYNQAISTAINSPQSLQARQHINRYKTTYNRLKSILGHLGITI